MSTHKPAFTAEGWGICRNQRHDHTVIDEALARLEEVRIVVSSAPQRRGPNGPAWRRSANVSSRLITINDREKRLYLTAQNGACLNWLHVGIPVSGCSNPINPKEDRASILGMIESAIYGLNIIRENRDNHASDSHAFFDMLKILMPEILSPDRRSDNEATFTLATPWRPITVYRKGDPIKTSRLSPEIVAALDKIAPKSFAMECHHGKEGIDISLMPHGWNSNQKFDPIRAMRQIKNLPPEILKILSQ